MPCDRLGTLLDKAGATCDGTNERTQKGTRPHCHHEASENHWAIVQPETCCHPKRDANNSAIKSKGAVPAAWSCQNAYLLNTRCVCRGKVLRINVHIRSHFYPPSDCRKLSGVSSRARPGAASSVPTSARASVMALASRATRWMLAARSASSGTEG